MRTSNVGVAGVEQAQQPGPSLVVEAFVGPGQQTPGPIQRVDLAAPMAQSVVLHPASDFVETLVGQPHQMERVGDLDGVGQHRVEHGPIRPAQVHGHEIDVGQPALTPAGQPGRGSSAITAFDHPTVGRQSSQHFHGAPSVSDEQGLPFPH